MRYSKRQRCTCLVLFIIVCILAVVPSAANGWQDPTLYHNDDVWYKDNGAPLIEKNGKYYIPVDILTMFDTITVETHAQDNLLLYADTADGVVYASILYGDRIAAVSGEIIEDVEIFRQNGYYYLNAEWICGILGLTTEYGENASGETILRLSNGESHRTLSQLTEANRTDTDISITPGGADNTDTNSAAKQICVFAGAIHAGWELDWLNRCGVHVTYLLDADSPADMQWSALLSGECAITADNTAEAEEINDILEAETYRRLPVICGELSDTEEIAAAKAGYMIVKPDFLVDSQTNPDSMYSMVIEWLMEHDRVVISVGLDGCSQRMLVLLAEYLAENTADVSSVFRPWKDGQH